MTTVMIPQRYEPNMRGLAKIQADYAPNVDKISEDNSYTINLQGLGGEFAVCVFFALDPLKYVTRGAGSDGGVDLVIPGSQKTVQIKTCPQGKNLLIPKEKPLVADIVILTEPNGAFMGCNLVGFTTRDAWREGATLKQMRHDRGKDYFFPRDKLQPMDDIWGVL